MHLVRPERRKVYHGAPGPIPDKSVRPRQLRHVDTRSPRRLRRERFDNRAVQFLLRLQRVQELRLRFLQKARRNNLLLKPWL